MARAHLRYVVTDSSGNAIQNAAVNVYKPGTTSVPYGTMYTTEAGATAQSNPLTSNARGEVETWMDTGQLVDLKVTDNGNAAYVSGDASQTRDWTDFTIKVQARPGAASTIATVGVQDSCFIIENHDTGVGTFVVQVDNGEGNGTMGVFGVENSNPGPIDVNFRNCVVNVGNTDPDTTFYGGVPFNFNSPTGSSGTYIRCWAPGVENTSPVAFSVSVNGIVTMNVGGIASNAIVVAVGGEAQPRWKMDENGKCYWGAGGASAVDVTLYRSAADILKTDDSLVIGAEANVVGALNHDGSTVGFYGVTPAARPSAYTQTYSTADKTHANVTSAAVVTTAATNVAPYGYAQAQADAIPVAINATQADLLDLKQLLNSVIDDLQALGLLQ